MSGLLRFSPNWRWKMQIFRFSRNFPWNWNAGQVLEERAQIHPLQMSSAFQHSPACKSRPVGPSLLYVLAAVCNAVGARFTCICPLSVSYPCDIVKLSLSASSLQHGASHLIWHSNSNVRKGGGYWRPRDWIDFGEPWADKTCFIH